MFNVLYKSYVALIVSLTFILLYPLIWIILNTQKPPYTFLYKVLRLSSIIILRFCGIFPKIIKKEELPPPPYIIAPNHTSYIDILSIYEAFKSYTIFMGKQELLYIPLFNILFKKMNIPVNRKDPEESSQAFKQAQQEVNNKTSVVIFPEATIPITAPKLGPIKKGAFLLAVKTNTPIIPVIFLDNWKRFGGHSLTDATSSPGPSKIIIEKPLFPEDYNFSIDELANQWITIVNNTLKAYSVIN